MLSQIYWKTSKIKDACVNFMEDIQDDWELTPNVKHAIFIDINKAFDTVSHGTLLRTSENCGLKGPMRTFTRL